MDDLSNMISQVLSDPQAMQQLQSMASSLGLTGGESADASPQQTPASAESGSAGTPQAAASDPGGGLDLSALASLLGGASSSGTASPANQPDLSALASLLGGASAPAAPAASTAGGVDLSALSGILGGLMGGAQSGAPANLPDGVAALTSLLNTGNPSGGQPQAPGLPFDMSTLLKLQQAMSSISANQANVQLLMALKPRLKPERAKKVDDAVRVMQLIQFLPLIKESGLFGNIDSLLGGSGGGLGGIVNGIGDGINGVLGGLFSGGRR